MVLLLWFLFFGFLISFQWLPMSFGQYVHKWIFWFVLVMIWLSAWPVRSEQFWMSSICWVSLLCVQRFHSSFLLDDLNRMLQRSTSSFDSPFWCLMPFRDGIYQTRWPVMAKSLACSNDRSIEALRCRWLFAHFQLSDSAHWIWVNRNMYKFCTPSRVWCWISRCWCPPGPWSDHVKCLQYSHSDSPEARPCFQGLCSGGIGTPVVFADASLHVFCHPLNNHAIACHYKGYSLAVQ